MLFAVHLFEFDDVEKLTNGFVFVGNQLEIEILFGFEVLLGAQAIPGDTDDHGVGRIEGGFAIPKIAAFGGAAGRTGFRVEVDDDLFAAQCRQRDGCVARGGGGKIRDGLAKFDRHKGSLSG